MASYAWAAQCNHARPAVPGADASRADNAHCRADLACSWDEVGGCCDDEQQVPSLVDVASDWHATGASASIAMARPTNRERRRGLMGLFASSNRPWSGYRAERAYWSGCLDGHAIVDGLPLIPRRGRHVSRREHEACRLPRGIRRAGRQIGAPAARRPGAGVNTRPGGRLAGALRWSRRHRPRSAPWH